MNRVYFISHKMGSLACADTEFLLGQSLTNLLCALYVDLISESPFFLVTWDFPPLEKPSLVVGLGCVSLSNLHPIVLLIPVHLLGCWQSSF